MEIKYVKIEDANIKNKKRDNKFNIHIYHEHRIIPQLRTRTSIIDKISDNIGKC
jgi:hypothetical protein